ncbi:MAG TPA: phosphatidate cytidylyltransferase [Candidatus Limnocylindria bacterium]|nr:phosphatidate cytidylyltransferase [Candidatus Limnocylindria bacterium]
MLRTRLATAAVAIPLLWLVVQWLWPPLFAAFILAVIAVGAVEYAAMAFPEEPRLRATAVAVTVAVGAGMMQPPPWPGVTVTAAFVVMLLGPLTASADLSSGVRAWAVAWFGVMYVGFLTPHVVLLRQTPPQGWQWVLFTIFAGMASDSGGYFGGRWFGRRKLFEAVSPSKTIEGALGSIAGAVLVALFCRAVFFERADVPTVMGLAVVVSILGQAGDLCESALKRAFGAKDSGWIVPGHGGILDRLDSLLLPVVFMYHWVAVVGG